MPKQIKSHLRARRGTEEGFRFGGETVILGTGSGGRSRAVASREGLFSTKSAAGSRSGCECWSPGGSPPSREQGGTRGRGQGGASVPRPGARPTGFATSTCHFGGRQCYPSSKLFACVTEKENKQKAPTWETSSLLILSHHENQRSTRSFPSETIPRDA